MSDHTVADVDAGRNLESIVDGNNKYSYTYDETGIRTSKTINGKTTCYSTKRSVNKTITIQSILNYLVNENLVRWLLTNENQKDHCLYDSDFSANINRRRNDI